jgi:hypothetical protein
MKDWEIKQVNELYKRMDALQQENDRLKEVGGCGASELSDAIKLMEGRLDQMAGAVQDVLVRLEEVKCKCTETKPARQYNKKSK